MRRIFGVRSLSISSSILCTSTIRRYAELLLSISWSCETCPRHVTSVSNKTSCCTYKIGNRVEFVLLKMRILVKSHIVRRVCWREFIRSLTVWCQSVPIDWWRSLLHLGSLSFRRILLSLWLKIFSRALRCQQFCTLKNSMIASASSSFRANRHKDLICRAETIFKNLWLCFPHFNAKGTLPVTLWTFATSSCRMIIFIINYRILGWILMPKNRLNQKLRVIAIEDHWLGGRLIFDESFLQAVLTLIRSRRDYLKLSATSRYVPIGIHQVLNIKIWLRNHLLREISNIGSAKLIMHVLLLRSHLMLSICYHGLGE